MRGLLPFLIRVFGNADKADWIVILTTTSIVLFMIVGIVIVVVFRSLKNINEKNKKYSP
jgi:thiosulfate reductase cytochrome b subunit